jgi:hypothetical protein
MVHDVQYTRRESGSWLDFPFGVSEGFRSLYIPGVFGFVSWLSYFLLSIYSSSATHLQLNLLRFTSETKQQNTLSDPTSQPISSISHEFAMTISQPFVPHPGTAAPDLPFRLFRLGISLPCVVFLSLLHADLSLFCYLGDVPYSVHREDVF